MPWQTSSPQGADHPRVELIPPYAYSEGKAAAVLAELAGLYLEPWQRRGLDAMLGVREDGRWSAFEFGEICPRQNGKSVLCMARALAGLLVLNEQLILWSAHEYKTALRSFLDLQGLIAALGERERDNLYDLGDGIHVKVDGNHGQESLQRLDDDGVTVGMIKMVARSKGSARGFSTDCLIVDEAFAYTDAHRSAMMPTLTARPNPQVVYASSPPLDRWSGEPMFELRARALAGDGGLAWRDWGVREDLDSIEAMSEDERADYLDDRARWAATNPALGRGRVTEESVLRNRRSMSWQGFAREILGAWPVPADEAGGKIDHRIWLDRRDPERLFAGRPVFAIEASNDRTSGSISLAGRRADGKAYVELQDDRPGQGLDWIPERAAELDRKAEALAWVIDPSGPAGALLPDLKTRGIEPVEVTGRAYVQACGGLYDAVMADDLRHGGQSQLDTAVKAARARDVGDGAWAWARRDSPADISRVIGVTLAHHLLLVLAPAEYDVLESAY